MFDRGVKVRLAGAITIARVDIRVGRQNTPTWVDWHPAGKRKHFFVGKVLAASDVRNVPVVGIEFAS